LPPHAKRRQILLAGTAFAAFIAVGLGAMLIMGDRLVKDMVALIDTRIYGTDQPAQDGLVGRGSHMGRLGTHPLQAVSSEDERARALKQNRIESVEARSARVSGPDEEQPDMTGTVGGGQNTGASAHDAVSGRDGATSVGIPAGSIPAEPNTVLYGGQRTSDKLKAWESH
jgi:hypothetical protein